MKLASDDSRKQIGAAISSGRPLLEVHRAEGPGPGGGVARPLLHQRFGHPRPHPARRHDVDPDVGSGVAASCRLKGDDRALGRAGVRNVVVVGRQPRSSDVDDGAPDRAGAAPDDVLADERAARVDAHHAVPALQRPLVSGPNSAWPAALSTASIRPRRATVSHDQRSTDAPRRRRRRPARCCRRVGGDPPRPEPRSRVDHAARPPPRRTAGRWRRRSPSRRRWRSTWPSNVIPSPSEAGDEATLVRLSWHPAQF